MEIEVWKNIDGYEGLYQISNYGRVKSCDRYVYSKKNGGFYFHIKEKIMKLNTTHDGYLFISLSKNGIKTPRRISRLVAEAFIPNPNNLPQVNHIDEDKSNNNVSNLEWCSNSYNVNYGSRNKKCKEKNAIKVCAIVKSTGAIEYYDSIMDAAEKLHYNSFSNISACVRGDRKSANGRIWKSIG